MRSWAVSKRLLLMWCLTAAALVLAGCGVPLDGAVGVGRDTEGNLRVNLRTCSHPMDGATLYWPDDPNGADSNNEVFAEWTIGPQPDPLRADWPLLGASDVGGVEAERRLDELPRPPKNMGIYAGTNNNSFSASGPYLFTAADLKRLRPGQVLVDNNTGKESDPPVKIVSIDAFNTLDCSQYG